MKNHSSPIRLLVFSFFFFAIGLNAYAQIKHFPIIDLSINQVQKHKDVLFVATKSSGLILIDLKNKSTKVYNKINSKIGSNDIKSVGIDTDNNIWFTTVLGLSVFKNGAFSVVKPRAKIYEGSDSHDFVFVDTKNNIWLQEAQIVYKIKEDGTILKKLGKMYSQITEAKELASGVIIIGSYKANSLEKIENDKLSNIPIKRYQDRLQVNKNVFWLGGGMHQFGRRKIENFNIVEKKQYPYSDNYFIDINGHPYRHLEDEKHKILKLRIPQLKERLHSLNPYYEKVIIAPNREPIITFFFDDQNDLYFLTRLGCYLVRDDSQKVEVITNFNNFIDYPSTEKVLIEATNQGSFWALYPDKIKFFKLDAQLNIDTMLTMSPLSSPDFEEQRYLPYFKLLSDSSTMLALEETTIDSVFLDKNEIKSIRRSQREKILPKKLQSKYSYSYKPFYYKDASTFYIMPYRNIFEISKIRDTVRIISPYFIPTETKKIRPYGESLYLLTKRKLSAYTKGFFRHIKLPKDEFKFLDGYVTDFEINENGSLFVQIDNRNIWKKDLGSKNGWIRVYPITNKKIAGSDFTILLGITKENSLIYQNHDGVYKFTQANEPVEIISNNFQYFKTAHSFSSNSSHYYLATDAGIFIFPKK